MDMHETIIYLIASNRIGFSGNYSVTLALNSRLLSSKEEKRLLKMVEQLS